MRKEVYQRKPKQAFKKLKNIYTEKSKLNKKLGDTEYQELKQLRNTGFKHFYQSKAFRIISLLSAITIGLVLIWQFVLSSYYYEYQKSLFEEIGISEYYKTNKTDLEIINTFFSKRQNKISSLYIDFMGYQTLNINSMDLGFSINIDSINRVTYYTDWTNKNCMVEENKLMISGKGFKKTTFSNNWKLSISFVNLNPIDQSILDYLETNSSQLENVLQILRKMNWTVSTYPDYTSIHFKYSIVDNYNLIFTKNSPSNLPDNMVFEGYSLLSGTISDGEVFWTKLEEMP